MKHIQLLICLILSFFMALRPVYCNEEPVITQEQSEEIAITGDGPELLPVDEQEEFSIEPALSLPQPAILVSGIASELLEPVPARFTCNERYPGYYADINKECRGFFVCSPSGGRHYFECGEETIFNQYELICDHKHRYNCRDAQRHFRVNEERRPFFV